MLLRRKEVLQLTSLSQSSLYRLMNASRFPRPLRVSPRCAWRCEEVEDDRPYAPRQSKGWWGAYPPSEDEAMKLLLMVVLATAPGSGAGTG